MSGGRAFGRAERGVFPPVRKQLGAPGTCWARATTVISACSGFGPSTRSEAASPPEPPPACPPGRWPALSPVGGAFFEIIGHIQRHEGIRLQVQAVRQRAGRIAAAADALETR